jgi:CarboxypepD_reg-like domain
MSFRRRSAFYLTVGFLLVGSASAASAQKKNARLNGAVFDKTSGSPIAGATVVFLGDGRAQITDSIGIFRFERLPMGISRFLVRAAGFPAGALIVALSDGEIMERKVELDSSAVEVRREAQRAAAEADAATAPSRGQLLAPVTVTEERSLGPRFVNFERRRKTGAGQYVVREEIERRGYSSLQDIARAMRGVVVECNGDASGCYARMVRAPMRCLPEYIVDDNSDPEFGPRVPVRDIEALEFYTGPSDVPGEYAGRNAGCGVIVIWTKSGPARRKK